MRDRVNVETPSRWRPAAAARQRSLVTSGLTGRWARFVGALIVTAVAVVPIAVVVVAAFKPLSVRGSQGLSLETFGLLWFQSPVPLWLRNSLLVSAVVVFVTVALAAPAGYVLSRGRGALISGYALALFILQSFPVVVAVVPLFFLFARIGLVDTLTAVTAIYAGLTIAAATWMMGAYYDSIPIEIEEAAWVDGASVFGAFVRVILRNSLPGLLSTAMFAFLTAWNDYLIVLVFIRSTDNYTLPLGMELFHPPGGPGSAYAVIMMLPPVIIFFVLNRYFSFGGIGGSLSGR